MITKKFNIRTKLLIIFVLFIADILVTLTLINYYFQLEAITANIKKQGETFFRLIRDSIEKKYHQINKVANYIEKQLSNLKIEDETKIEFFLKDYEEKIKDLDPLIRCEVFTRQFNGRYGDFGSSLIKPEIRGIRIELRKTTKYLAKQDLMFRVYTYFTKSDLEELKSKYNFEVLFDFKNLLFTNLNEEYIEIIKSQVIEKPLEFIEDSKNPINIFSVPFYDFYGKEIGDIKIVFGRNLRLNQLSKIKTLQFYTTMITFFILGAIIYIFGEKFSNFFANLEVATKWLSDSEFTKAKEISKSTKEFRDFWNYFNFLISSLQKKEEEYLNKVYELIEKNMDLEDKFTIEMMKYKQLAAVLNSMECQIIVVDRNYNIIDANTCFLRNCNKKYEDVLGKKCYEVVYGFSEPCMDENHFCPHSFVFKTNAPLKIIHKHYLKNNSNKYFQVIAIPFKEVNNKAIYMIEVFWDFTRQEELESNIVQASKLATMGEMLSSFAHEVNNPLGIALTRIDYLLTKFSSDVKNSEVVEDLKAIKKQINRISYISNSLLRFAQKTSFKVEKININEILDRSIDLIRAKLKDKRLKIVKNYNNFLPPIWGESVQLIQVFINILLNAIDASPEGGVIYINNELKGRYVIINIKDEGPGIPSEILDRIFEPFFTTKSGRGGTGLGLAVSYALIKNHKGEINVETIPDGGTTFRIKLPIIET